MTIFRGYIGTYTKGDSKGIYTFTLDTETATFSAPELAAQVENPTYICLNEEHQTLYTVAKMKEQGGVAAYRIHEQDGTLEFFYLQVTDGSSPCHISVDQANQHIVTAYYHRGIAEIHPIIDGELEPVSSLVQFQGHGPHKQRQEKSHAHFAGFTPDDKHVVIVDLGTDKITTYRIDHQHFQEVHVLSVKPGSGPRHITFHPNGRFAYVMTELSNEIIALAYDDQEGAFTEIQYISTIPNDFTENSQGSAIHISADGKFVYAGNRGHDSIAIFAVHETSGLLTFVEHISTHGHWPRDFMFDPSEQYVVVANEESHNLVLFARNAETGHLTKCSAEAHVPYPVCVKFIKPHSK
ncbi:MAG: lactonase family protein [Bacillus sp. (in: firmicutes)]